MSNYTVSRGNVGVYDKTLAADTIDVVTFTGVDLDQVEIATDGSHDVYVTFGAGSTPMVGGGNSYRIPAVAGYTVFPVHTSGDTVVKLISSGVPLYSVTNPT
jgi:hypothetical protein